MSDTSTGNQAAPADADNPPVPDDGAEKAKAAEAQAKADEEARVAAEAAAAKAAKEAAAKAAAEVRDRTKIVAGKLDTLKTRLGQAADKVEAEESFKQYAHQFHDDVERKVAEVIAWIDRHL